MWGKDVSVIFLTSLFLKSYQTLRSKNTERNLISYWYLSLEPSFPDYA